MTKTIAKSHGGIKAAAQEILGHPRASLLSAKQRGEMWRIAFGSDDITALDGIAVNRANETVNPRRHVA